MKLLVAQIFYIITSGFVFWWLCISSFSLKLNPTWGLCQAINMNLCPFPNFFFFLQRCSPSINVFHIFNTKKKNTMPKIFQNGHWKFITHTPGMKFRGGALTWSVFICFSNTSYYFESCFWFWKILVSSTAQFRKYLCPEQQLINMCLFQTWF